ncbi:MAG: sel1 repeat family protein, partial [Gammaproteobacteria bacterium]|nr:sel1 repeat family protein [Gammaproteobacteria bacterium]
RKTEKTGSSGGKFVSGEVAADSFLSNGISMDELAASRVSADNLFADGVAIDEAGKAVGRGGYNPQKLDADDMLRIDDLSSGGSISANSISNSSPKTRPIGPAASLLPKSRNDQPSFDVSVSSNDDIAHPDMQPTDLSAPMTNNEERSLAEVHFNIGLMFSSGDGVPQNEAQAAKWFLKAAEEGLPEAQFNIGQCYLTGSGVQKDSTLAMDWIQKAANNNYKPAQEELRKKNRAS